MQDNKLIITVCTLLCVGTIVDVLLFMRPMLPYLSDAGSSSSTGTTTFSTTPPTTQPTTLPTTESTAHPAHPDIPTLECIHQPPVLPIPPEHATGEEWIRFFHSLLGTLDSWYNRAITMQFASTEQIDLNLLFYNGTYSNSEPLTDAEIAFLSEHNWEFNLDTLRVYTSEIQSILQIYFDTTMETCTKHIPYVSTYFPQTDCYYNAASGANICEIDSIVDYTQLDNGDYVVRYVYFESIYEVQLRPVEQHFQVIANRILEQTQNNNQ